MQKCVCLSDIALKSPLLANGGAPMSFFSLHPRHGRPGRRGGGSAALGRHNYVIAVPLRLQFRTRYPPFAIFTRGSIIVDAELVPDIIAILAPRIAKNAPRAARS